MSDIIRDKPMRYEYREGYRTRTRGKLKDEYEIYLVNADDGSGGDITRPGKTLKTFDDWLNS